MGRAQRNEERLGIDGQRPGTARPFPLRRLHSGPQSSSFRSMSGNAPRTPESSVADAMRTSVVTRNYRQINSRVATRNSSGTDFKSHRSPEGFPRFANILSWSGSYSRHFSCEQHDAVLGRQVRSIAGEDMGRVVNVVVDQSGQVRAAIIDFGGLLGIGNRKIAIDWN